MTADQPKLRANYLTVAQAFNLQHACRMLTAAFSYNTYHVGSSLLRPDWRDVDLRCILDDDEYDTMFAGNDHRLALMNTAIAEWLQARTGLPIDFQFQRRTDANANYRGPRSFLGEPLPAEN